MSKTVLQFVLGIDLSNINLSQTDIQPVFEIMQRLQWLHLNQSNLSKLPQGLDKLSKLQKLTISKNQIEDLTDYEWFKSLKSLQNFVARKNKLRNDSLPEKLLANPQLEVVDLSFNLLTEIPTGLFQSKGLLVLNLSNNQISSVPKELFFNCASLMMIDLSNNVIETFPTNLRRMPNLKSLNLSNNPMKVSQLRSICGLKKLESLNLSNTARKFDTFPPDLDRLLVLTELDISNNNLPRLPQTVYEIPSLTKLNLSGNMFETIDNQVDSIWPNMEVLNLSCNQINALPSFITRLTKLKKLYLDENQLSFSGLPIGLGKLSKLEVFSAANNQLENIPEGLCRCGELRILNLRNNRLLTLPDAIHVLIETLTVFNIDNNPHLKMPPKLDANASTTSVDGTRSQSTEHEYYNADFSLDYQMKQISGLTIVHRPAQDKAASNTGKDSIARIRRMRRRHLNESSEQQDESSKCVLEGMQKVARDKDAVLEEREKDKERAMIQSKRWQDGLNKPNIDYSKLFDEDVGQEEGLELWDIDDLYPRRIVDDLLYGTFYNGDCYIVLYTRYNESSTSNSQLQHTIYYWIGREATLDKITCSAMHAVSLRNCVRAESRCERVEQGEEPPEFLELFDGGKIQIVDGANGETGFVRMERVVHRKKLYRLYGGAKSLDIYSCDPVAQSLDSRYAYLFDVSAQRLFVWLGKSSSIMLRKKARLLAEKIIQKERKNNCELSVELDGKETEDFKSSFHLHEQIDWKTLNRRHLPDNWAPEQPVVFGLKVGSGYLELPQVQLPANQIKLSKSLLKQGQVFIIQSAGDIFIWIATNTIDFFKQAAIKLAYEFIEMILPNYTREPIMCCQNLEPYVFKMQFHDWEDPISVVDFTRQMDSAPSQNRGASDSVDKIQPQPLRTDMKAFFMPREKPTDWEEAAQLMDEYNEDLLPADPQSTPIDKPLKFIKQFIYDKRRWLPVDETWMGHFFSEDCYIIYAEYWDFPEEDEEDPEHIDDAGLEDSAESRPRILPVIYFWQGRQASNVLWLTFNLSTLKEMEERLCPSTRTLGDDRTERLKVEFRKMLQQQELSQFMAHFKYKFVIHQGKFVNHNSDQRRQTPQMYCMRDNGNPICARTIEIKPIKSYLNSCFHYLLKIPARINGTDKTIVVCWLGEKANRNYDSVIEEIAATITEEEPKEVLVVKEGSEPGYFWKSMIGGADQAYDKEAEFTKFSRLFRLSNEQGYFCASEKCSDFCQDDLADEDVMLLDTGSQIYVWFGGRTSEVEKKLSLKAAKLYSEHISRIQPEKSRSLKITTKKKEPHNFRRCFHGWGQFNEVKDWAG